MIVVNAYLFGGGGGAPSFVPQSGDFSITMNSPVVTDGAHSLKMSGADQGSTSSDVRGLLNLIPAGDFDVVVRLKVKHTTAFNGAGIVFRDTGGKLISVENGLWGEFRSIVRQWNSATSFNSDMAGYREHGVASAPRWLKASFNSATNDVQGFCSYEAVDGVPDHWTSFGTSTFLGTVDAVGIGIINARSGATPQLAPFAFFEHYEVI